MVTLLITIVGFFFALMAFAPLLVAADMDVLTMHSPLHTGHNRAESAAPLIAVGEQKKKQLLIGRCLQPVTNSS